MSGAAQPFGRGAVLVAIVVGALAFLIFLFAIGAGWDGRNDRDGGSHAAANGLNGYSALAGLLRAEGEEVLFSRSREGFAENGALLVLTPPHGADGDELRHLLAERAWRGPTLVILPKWYAAPLSRLESEQGKPGWVRLIASASPEWVAEMTGIAGLAADIGPVPRWEGLGLDMTPPDPAEVQFFTGPGLVPLVTGPGGEVLAGQARREDADDWPVVFVAEPDLLNNRALAERESALLATRIIERAMDGAELAVVFDLTLPGLGQQPNLLTLAFRPPFLAATLCLLLAAGVIGWRAFHRFGPATAAAPAHAPGKRLLAANGAALIERAGRARLLGRPYAALAAARIAARLGVKTAEPARRGTEIARIAMARGVAEPGLLAALEAVHEARNATELLRAARALRTIERTLLP